MFTQNEYLIAIINVFDTQGGILMQRVSARRNLFVISVTALIALIVGAGVVYAETMTATQPAYPGMTFYIHQPQGIPANWHTTLDGFPVWRGSDGVWFYGSYSERGITRTYYAVGSVNPSEVGIKPYETYYAPYAAPQPALEIDPRFMALGTCGLRENVDRVGILAKPAIPVAWKGTKPNVLYAWTGTQWFRMTTRADDEKPEDVLKRNLYTLTRQVHQSGNRIWQDVDVFFLCSQAAHWGYSWMGKIDLNPPPPALPCRPNCHQCIYGR